MSVQMSAGSTMTCFELSPTAARDLAAHLLTAADAAEQPLPTDVLPGLYREPEAA